MSESYLALERERCGYVIREFVDLDLPKSDRPVALGRATRRPKLGSLLAHGGDGGSGGN